MLIGVFTISVSILTITVKFRNKYIMPTYTKKSSKFLYEKIIDNVSSQISKGILKPGEQLPSVRSLSDELGVSISTILQSYISLENLGLVEAKPQSGYYVRLKSTKVLPEPEILNIETAIRSYGSEELIDNVHELSKVPNIISLGAGIPNQDILPVKQLNRIVSSISKGLETGCITYEFPPGNYKLRREIAKRSYEAGYNISPDEIIITSGAIEALTLSLRAITKPGDTIITESPTYYLILQLIKSLGLKTLEIPTHPRDGIDINSLKEVTTSHNIAACIFYPTINNPLGSIIPEENRKKIYKVLAAKNIPLIEGNVYGELCFNKIRPKPIKAYDDKGLVLYFSSFSKTVAPGFRTGWISPGRYFEKIKKLKFLTSIATSSLPQIALSEFVRTGGYERHLKYLRKVYSSRISCLSDYISEFFPDGTKIARPQGGFYLWIELPKSVNSIKLQREALKENISIAPGPLFSTRENFLNYIRLSCACEWNSTKIKNAIYTLGKLCKKY